MKNSISHAGRVKVNVQIFGLVFNSCALFEKLYLKRKNEPMRYKAFCGKYNREYASWLINVINFLVT
jgi:hypothetical protein